MPNGTQADGKLCVKDMSQAVSCGYKTKSVVVVRKQTGYKTKSVGANCEKLNPQIVERRRFQQGGWMLCVAAGIGIQDRTMSKQKDTC